MKQPIKKSALPKKEEVHFGVKISSVKVDEMFFREPEQEIINNFDPDLLKIQISLRFNTQAHNGIIAAFINIDYKYWQDKDTPAEPENKLLDFKGVFEFEITNINSIITETKDGLEIKYPILGMLASIAVSTTRGIILTRTAGSFLSSHVVPLVNPDELIKNMKAVRPE